MVLPRIMAAYRGGDNHLLSGVSRIVEDHGFRLLGAHEVAPEILVPEGVLGRIDASEQHRQDIAFGFDYLRASGAFDIGQAVVVAGKRVLAVEAAEGTDQMLTRVAELRIAGRIGGPPGIGVLVKAPKPEQDRRFDLPSIGPNTVTGVPARRQGERPGHPRRPWTSRQIDLGVVEILQRVREGQRGPRRSKVKTGATTPRQEEGRPGRRERMVEGKRR